MLHRTLQDRLVQVMAAMLARQRLDVRPRRGEEPLPHPLPARVRVFPGKGSRKLHPAGAGLQISAMLLSDALQVPGEVWFHDGRQHRHAVLVALALAHGKLPLGYIDVFDP